MRPERQKSRTIFVLRVCFLRIPDLLPNAPPIVKGLNTSCDVGCVFSLRPSDLRAFVLVIRIKCSRLGGGVVGVFFSGHQFRARTADETGPTNSALTGPNACIRGALRCVKAAVAPVCLVLRSLPVKNETRTTKIAHNFCSPCLFSYGFPISYRMNPP